jgi:transcriptional regulator of aromatic amino acid metabolism
MVRSVCNESPPLITNWPEVLVTNLLGSRLPSSVRSNLLVNCSEDDLPRIFRELERWCSPAVHACVLPGCLELPDRYAGTLLLTRVEEMSPDQQVALYDWMTRMHATARVVSVATKPLDRLVRQGRFLEDLFYRLNVLQMESGVDASLDERVLDDASCRA